MDIRNYIKASERIHTSGQPRAEEFKHIAELSVVCVINLAMPTSDYAIAHEGAIVTSHGMNYIHIPVQWETPEDKQYDFFRSLLLSHDCDQIWVHCALNYRVSCFMYCYKVGCMGIQPELAYQELSSFWQPNKVWQQFIDRNA